MANNLATNAAFGGISYSLVEILNGMLAVTLFWMTWFIFLHMKQMWKNNLAVQHRHAPSDGILTRWHKTLNAVYRNNKPEIALFVIMLGLGLRTAVLWYNRWIERHDENYQDFITSYSVELLLFFTVMIIIGVTCWIRVLSPLEGTKAFLLWLGIMCSAVSFAVFMFYY